MNANPSRPRLAAAGVLTGLAGIATSIAAAWLLHTINPVVAVASAVRDAVPGPLAIKLIHLVQHADKPLLVVGTTLALLVLSAYAGTLTRRSDVLAALVFVAMAVLGVFAELRRPGGGSTGVLTVVVGLLTWLVVLPLLTSPVAHPANGSRRAFLARSGAVVLGGAVVLAAGRAAGSGRRAVEQARKRLRLPVSKGEAPASADLGVPGIAPWRTPNSQFYQIDTTISAPSIEPNSWRLRVHGMVDKEITLTYHDLVSRQLIADWVTICCVSNEVGGPLIGNAHWSGVPIRTVLAEAGVHSGADAVLQTSHDGWTAGTPLSALTDPKRS
ncbi:MAG: molybdopterin-dependent oxidoreductase, partial [Actinomycetota bacterium]|nr:molybdopterin-dependent oxidoreductase [Actinomycetota bacterium]